MSSRITGADVARLAGVSRQTVSYVLNDTPNQTIPETTRSRVLNAARELGYTPNAAAKLLRGGRNDMVLVVMPSVSASQALVNAIQAIVTRLHAHGLSTLVHFEDGDPDALRRCCERLQPCGLIDLSWQGLPDDLARLLHASGTQTLGLEMGATRSPLPTVIADQADIGRVALEHLVERGHRSVLALRPTDPSLTLLADRRLGGASAAANQAGIRYDERSVDEDADAILALVRSVLDDGGPTALLAYNDEFALLALGALLHLGVSVPERMAVIGCDNSPSARAFRPGLTTTRIHEQVLGTQLADTLQSLLQGELLDREILAPSPVVMVREST